MWFSHKISDDDHGTIPIKYQYGSGAAAVRTSQLYKGETVREEEHERLQEIRKSRHGGRAKGKIEEGRLHPCRHRSVIKTKEEKRRDHRLREKFRVKSEAVVEHQAVPWQVLRNTTSSPRRSSSSGLAAKSRGGCHCAVNEMLRSTFKFIDSQGEMFSIWKTTT